MTCYHPIKAYRSREKDPSTGKYGITFNATKALIEGTSFAVPCGRCIGCRIDKSYQWAMRCLHEAQMHDQNSFITLTYDQQSVPVDYSLKLRDWQLFMKRLRKNSGANMRFFASGEYGDRGLRPHYHALIFGYDFPDKRFHRTTPRGDRLYVSDFLNETWGKGQLNEIGAVTFKSAAYTARYVIKKQGGDQADSHYMRVSPIDGNTYRVATEFAVMSRRPGIGTTWFDKFKTDAFPSDFLIIEGRKVKPPHFYLNKISEAEQLKIKRERKRFSVQPRQKLNSTSERLKVREEVQSLRAKRLQRTLES